MMDSVLISSFASFAKLEIGGPKEILIMWLRSRMMVRLMEALCRALAKMLPEEMLPNPKKEEFFTEVSRRNKSFMIGLVSPFTLSLNLDTTRWNQRWTSMKSIVVIRIQFKGSWVPPRSTTPQTQKLPSMANNGKCMGTRRNRTSNF